MGRQNREEYPALSFNKMKAPVPASLFFLVLWATALAAGAQEWATFTDTSRHFQVEYPSSWKIVTFTKHEPDQPKQTWSFRVLASGEVRFPLDDSLARVKAAVSNLVSRLPDLSLIGVTEHENEVIAYYTVGQGPHAGYGVGRADLTVHIDSYTSEPEAKRQLRQSEATRPVLPRILETYQGSPVFEWAGGSVLGRVGTHVIDLSSLKGSFIPAMTNMFKGLAEELKKP